MKYPNCNILLFKFVLPVGFIGVSTVFGNPPVVAQEHNSSCLAIDQTTAAPPQCRQMFLQICKASGLMAARTLTVQEVEDHFIKLVGAKEFSWATGMAPSGRITVITPIASSGCARFDKISKRFIQVSGCCSKFKRGENNYLFEIYFPNLRIVPKKMYI